MYMHIYYSRNAYIGPTLGEAILMAGCVSAGLEKYWRALLAADAAAVSGHIALSFIIRCFVCLFCMRFASIGSMLKTNNCTESGISLLHGGKRIFSSFTIRHNLCVFRT